jgi:tetratricopeptide (TPR) repeat protein
MGLAMRVARYFPTVVIGAASLATQICMPQSCNAWDSIPASALEQSYDLEGSNVISDSAVQPAAYYDSRPRTNSSAQYSQYPQNTQSADDSDASNANPKYQGPMYRGQKVKMPTLPFGRPTPSNQAAQSTPASGYASSAFGPSAQSKNTAQGQPLNWQSQQRMPANGQMPLPAGASYQSARTANGRPPEGTLQDPRMRTASLPTAALPIPAAPSTHMPNAAQVSPWQANPAVAPVAMPVKTTESQPAAMSSAADRLIAEAHELSNHASTDQDYTQIIETCQRAQSIDAGPATKQYTNNLLAWSYNRRGQLKAEAGSDQEAIVDFNAAVQADPNCWRALHNRGVLIAQAGQFEKAFDDFSRTIKLNPTFAKAYSNRAALFMVADNLKAARQDYDHAIALDRNLGVAHRGCGRVCQLMGNMHEAIVHYDAAVRLSPDDSYAAACRADLLTDLGRYSDAAKEYNRAIDLDPNSTQAQSGSAWLLATCPDKSIRNPDLAIQRAQIVIQLGGDKEAISFDTLAAAQANAGDFEAAMNSARRAIELAPADEKDAYKARFVMYQQAKPYRIAPVERMAQQASYESPGGTSGVARK